MSKFCFICIAAYISFTPGVFNVLPSNLNKPQNNGNDFYDFPFNPVFSSLRIVFKRFSLFFFCLETLWCVTATLRLEASDLEVLFNFYPQGKEGKIDIAQVRLPAKQI